MQILITMKVVKESKNEEKANTGDHIDCWCYSVFVFPMEPIPFIQWPSMGRINRYIHASPVRRHWNHLCGDTKEEMADIRKCDPYSCASVINAIHSLNTIQR